jgi:exodeoxyribonuclease-3
MRIDHILTNKSLVNKIKVAAIDKEPRKSERPSDHTPVFIEI